MSGAREIRLLGLDGAYAQMMTESLPNLRGLGSTFGLSYVPGPWVESIQVVKGTGSVRNGYESMTGGINVEYKKPHEEEKFHLNLYGSHLGRLEGNFISATDANEKWLTMLLGHASTLQQQVDENKDGFLDMPTYTNFQLMNRWHYQGQKMESQLGIKGLTENRLGGQLSFDEDVPRTTANGYGIGIETQRVEAFAKAGFFFLKNTVR